MTLTSDIVSHAGPIALQHLRGDILAVLCWADELLHALRKAGCVRAAMLGYEGD